MNTILTKLKDFVGLNENEEYYDYEEESTGDDYQHLYQEDPPQLEVREPQSRRFNQDQLAVTSEIGMEPTTRSNVIGMPGITNAMAEVVVIEPHSFEEMPQVIQTLRERRSVILNLNVMEPEEAQRAVDFVAGGTYAIDGHQERVGESVFLFTPSCVKVSTHLGDGVGEEPEMSDMSSATARSNPPTPSWLAEASRIAQ